MGSNECNICGGTFKYENGKWRCINCRSYRAEDITDDEEISLSNAGQLLRKGDFTNAEESYRDIVRRYPNSPEAHWGLVLSRHYIKFEDDGNGNKLPTCYAATMKSFLDDKDYLAAVEHAGREQKEDYKEKAGVIERNRQEWAEKASKEPDYDVFLSYKDADKENGGGRTQDSIDVERLYNRLKDKGYNVFYSRITLKDKAGEKYEPYIYHALNTASVMVVYGSKPEYFESTWIKNEWTRYQKLMRDGEKVDDSLIVACKNMDPSELPSVLRSLQALDANSKTFYEDLVKKIKIIKASPTERKKGDSFSARKPSGEVENARKNIIDAAESVYRKSGSRHCSAKASELESLLQYSMLQIALSDRDFDKKEAEMIAGIALKDDLFRHLKDTCNGIDNWEGLYRASAEKRGKVMTNLRDDMERIADRFVSAAQKMTDLDEADRYLSSMKQSWDTILDAVINADGVRSAQEMGNGCLIVDMLDDAQENIQKRRPKKASRKPLSVGTKKFIRFIAIFLIAAAAIGAVFMWGISFYKRQTLSYREITGGYEVYCSSEYEGGSTLTIPSTHDGQKVIAVASSGFRDRTEIKSVILPDTIQSIGKDAFSGCTNLENISFPEGLRKIGSRAFAETGIEEAELSAAISSFGTGVFSGCRQLTTVVFQEGIEAIAESTFRGSAVKSVTLPSTIRTIGENAFSGCTQLKSVTLPSGLETIADEAFSGSGLETLFLPETVKTVGNDAFGNCAKLNIIKIAQDNSVPSTWAKTWNDGTDAAIGFVYCCNLDCASADDMDSCTVYFDPANPLAFPVPTRQGYSFRGWLNEETTVSDSEGNLLSAEIINGFCTLTPEWEALVNRITFNANGGKGTMGKLSILSDQSCKLLTNQFTREGYTFLGWSSSKDASKATYTDGATYKIGTDSVTLYAVWKANENRIIFHANGGKGSMESQVVLSDHSAALTANRYTRDGYSFLGWAVANNTGVATYADGASFTMGTKSVTLYAVWIKSGGTTTLRSNSEQNSVVITGQGAYTDTIKPGLNVKDLIDNGFSKVLITVSFDCSEIDDGYQDVEICSIGGKSLASGTVEHGSGLFPNKTWGTEKCSFTVSLSDLASDGSFVIKWSAHGKLDNDWKLGHTEITVEALRK